MSSILRWVLLALLGLLVAGAVAFLAIRTVSEKIGIASEPPAAGRALAPVPKEPARKKPDTDAASPASAPAAAPAPPQPAPAPAGDDYANGPEPEPHDD